MSREDMVMIVRRISTVLLCAAVLAAGACAPHTDPVQVYDGPQHPSQEVVKLIALSSLEVLAVDGKKIDLPYFSAKRYEMELLPGSRKLKVIYRESWRMPDASSQLVVSDAFLFQWNAKAGAVYKLTHDGPTRDQPVDEFTKLPNIWLVDPETGQRIEPTAREKYGAPVVRMFRRPAASDTAPADAGKRPSASGPSSAVQAEDIVMQQDALNRLKFWWKGAGTDERQAFREWVGTESPSAGNTGSASQAEDIVMQQDDFKRLRFWWKMADEKDRKAFREWMGTESP